MSLAGSSTTTAPLRPRRNVSRAWLSLLLAVGCAGLHDQSTTPIARPQSPPGAERASRAACGTLPVPAAGVFRRIFEPGAGDVLPSYINDHSIVRGRDGRWHLFGIRRREPPLPKAEREFVHASSPELTAPHWKNHGTALRADETLGEALLWAPHIVEHAGTYHMFYCAGGEKGSAYQIRLATSPDLERWTRVPEPLFEDGFEARDPFVLRIDGRWVMYYTATDMPDGGHHIVAYRTSDDLRTWSERQVAYRDQDQGKGAGPTESPFLLHRDGGYYLLIGPYADYVSTGVYFSRDPLHFEGPAVAEIEAHAPEVVRDIDGREYISRAGWGQGGVDLAPLEWTCRASARK